MDYANEEWVKFYVRSTPEWRTLSPMARLISTEVTRAMGRHTDELVLGRSGLRAVAAVVDVPWEDAEPALAELLDAGKLVYIAERQVLHDPKHKRRQEARVSAAQRKRDQRARERGDDPEDDGGGEGVTRGHAESRAVTPSHARSPESQSESHAVDTMSRSEEKRSEESEQTQVSDPPARTHEEHEPGQRPALRLVVPADTPSSPRAKRDLGTRRFEQGFFTTAFADGVTAVTGAPYTVPRRETPDLDDAIDDHAPLGGVPVDWVRASAETYRRAIAGREKYHRQGGPAGWLEWLNNGAQNARQLATTPEEYAQEQREVQRRDRAESSRRKADRAEREAEAEAMEDPEARLAAARRALAALGS